MDSVRESKNQITEGVIWKQLLIFCFPIMLGTLFQQMYNAADVIVVGQFVGKQALASVGGSSQVINLVVNFFVGITSGVTVVVSRFFGANQKEELKKAIHTSIAISIIGSIILSVVGMMFARELLIMLSTPNDILDDSTLYLCIYFSGIIFVFLYNIGSSILRAMGDSKRPLYYLIVCCIVNILLDILLVIVFKLGVTGVAIATVSAQAISALLVIYALTKVDDDYCLMIKDIRFYIDSLKSIIKIGMPAGVQSIMNSISGLMMATAINSLGTTAVAGNTAYAKLDGIFWMISTAFSVSIATFVGQNYGAKKYDRMKKSIWICLGLDFAVSCGLSLFFMICGPTLLYLFTSDYEVIVQGKEVLKAIAPYYAIVSFYEILTSALRGIGDVFIPMIINIIGLCFVRIVWIMLLSNADLYTIILSCPVSWSITALMMMIYFIFKYKKFQF